jgi:hypothetical protein
MFHTVFSLFVNSGITIARWRTADKWQNSEMEKAAKAAFESFKLLQKNAVLIPAHCREEYGRSMLRPLQNQRAEITAVAAQRHPF